VNKIIIGYTGKHIKFLLVENGTKVSFVDQQEYADANIFFLEPKINHKRITELSSIISTVFRKNNFHFDTAGLVLDSRLAYMSMIPVDFTDEAENINSSLIWELSNFYPDTYKNFKISYQRIDSNKDEYAYLGNTLIIAYHKNIAEITRRLSELTGIKFTGINFDNFAAGKYFLGKSEKDFILLGLKQEKTDIMHYFNGEIRNYTGLYKNNETKFGSGEIENILKIPGFSGINKVFIYGEESAVQYGEKINAEYKQTVIVNPFSNFSADSILQENAAIIPYSFTPLFGLVR